MKASLEIYMRSRQRGITLMELMVVVTVVAILAAIAYPSYQEQTRKARRSEAKAALLQIQVAQEKRFLASNTYVTTTAGISTNWAGGGLGLQANSTNGYYTLSIDAGATATSYVARATRAGAQTGDSCGNYTISSTGAKGPTTSGCW